MNPPRMIAHRTQRNLLGIEKLDIPSKIRGN